MLTPAHGVPAASPAHGVGPAASPALRGPDPASTGGATPSFGAVAAEFTAAQSTPAHGLATSAPSRALSGTRGTRRSAWGRALEHFWQAVDRAATALHAYPANNPVHREYFGQVQTLLEELLVRQSPLMLSVVGPTLRWSSESVFEDVDPENGLLANLSRQGIEHVCFARGLGEDDLARIIRVLAGLGSNDGHLDLAAQLVGIDARYFQCALTDPFDPVSPVPRALTAEQDQYRQFILHTSDAAVVAEPPAEALAGWAPPAPLPWVEALDVEMSERRQELQQQDARGPLTARAMVLLMRALGAEAEPSAETPAWRLLTELIRAIIVGGHLQDAQALLDRMDDYARRSGSAPVQRIAEGVRGWLSSEDMVRTVLVQVEQMADPTALRAAVVGYLNRLGPAAEPALWSMARSLRTEMARRHVAEVLVQFLERAPQSVFHRLSEQSPSMVIDLVTQAEARRTTVGDHVWWFGLEHRDGAVRTPATKLLRRRDGPVTEAVLLDKLDDQDPQVRMAALDAIGVRRRQLLLDRVQRYFNFEDVDRYADAEIGMAMIALARIAGARAVPQLSQILLEGHRFGLGAKTVEVQVRAAQVLGAVPDGSAVKALQQGAQSRQPRLRSTSQRALEGQFAHGLAVEPAPDIDLHPRPAGLTRLGSTSTPAGRAPTTESRQVARGIVGLPNESGEGDA